MPPRKAKASTTKTSISTSKPNLPDEGSSRRSNPPWPALGLYPPPSSRSLTLHTLLPHQILTIDLLTSKECHSLISHALSTFPLTPANPGLVPKKGEAFRDNDRVSLVDPEFAEQLWRNTGLAGVCETQSNEVWDAKSRRPVGLNSNIRIYRYRPGQRFGAHYDDSTKDPCSGIQTEWTLLIYLSSVARGGETVFYLEKGRGEVVAEPRAGMALLHRHGRHCLLHEAKEVVEGEKWILRSDLLFA
ncbi:uncharacterized protein VTP21DRAFT_6428 [Calcarisporiella thermophila]|uniref:uncharacterized protein n=1 Tax=Calcarisporiella thermophila TaxID=911321 RepID=UPI003742CCDE